MVAPGMIPGFRRRTRNQLQLSLRSRYRLSIRNGDLKTFVEFSLGVASDDFKRMASSYMGRWDLVQFAARTS